MLKTEQTLVVIPSLSFPPHELATVKGISRYEERLLYVILNMQQPVLYITSTPLDPYILDYYFSLLPVDSTLFKTLSVGNDEFLPLAQKIIDHPRLLQRIKKMAGKSATLMVIRGTALERTLSHRLSMQMDSATPEQQFWGTKAGSRQIFKTCEIPHPDGTFEPIFDTNTLACEILKVVLRNQCKKGIVKLLDGYAGRGNAVIDLEFCSDVDSVLKALHEMKFICPTHTFTSFEKEIQEMGCIFELFMEHDDPICITSPSVQVVIQDYVTILSSHEQQLDGQCYTGCIFPAHSDYAKEIIDYSKRVGHVLQQKGIRDHFSVDFLCIKTFNGWLVNAIEINLRLTGTTHPFMEFDSLVQGSFTSDGMYLVDGEERCYVSSDHVENCKLKTLLPIDVLEFSQKYKELGWNRMTKKGVVFHLLGCLSQCGSIGITAIGATTDEAQLIFNAAVEKLIELA